MIVRAIYKYKNNKVAKGQKTVESTVHLIPLLHELNSSPNLSF